VTAANRFLDALNAPRTRPLVIAHRGDSGYAPENTLEAARRGYEVGADAWELDVQLTRDRVAVVVHDESLLRTTDVLLRFPDDPRAGAGYLVSEFDLAEVRTLDAGSWFLSDRPAGRTAADLGTRDRLGPDAVARYASGGVRIPTLRECLRLTAELDWLVNVELKSFPNADAGLVSAVLSEVGGLGVTDRVLVSSFDHGDAARAARSGMPLAVGVLSHTPLYQPERYVREAVGADCYHPSSLALGSGSAKYRLQPRPENLRVADLDALAVARVPVLVYTVNDPRRGGLAAHLARAGVSGIFTDTPGEILEVLDAG